MSSPASPSPSDKSGNTTNYTLVWVTAALCAVPPLLNLAGIDFGTPTKYLDVRDWRVADEPERRQAYFQILRGPIVHTLIEWTGVCIAILTAIVSFVHYFLKRDITTPVIGTALLFVGVFDGFRVLAIDRLLLPIQDPGSFVGLTWAVSRNFHILIIVVGTLPFLFGDARQHRLRRDLRDYLLLFVVFAVGSLTMMYYFANSAGPTAGGLANSSETLLPTSLGKKDLRAEVLNGIALGLYIIAGGSVLMRYQRKHPSLFSRSLQASIVPHVCAQVYSTLGHGDPYDNGFHLASGYKLLGYCLPLVGLMLDYRRASVADSELKTTERQLDIARQISESLLPANPPAVAGWDVAGFSKSSEAVGGDYFDYVQLPDQSWLVLIADVSGHDLGAALLTADARSYLKALAETQDDLRFLSTKLNSLVGRSARQRRFITAFLVRLHAHDPRFSYVDAGHTGFIIESDGQVRSLSQQNVPLGIADDIAEPPGQSELADDETLVLVTDGIVETLNPQGQQFGMQRLATAICRSAGDGSVNAVEHVRQDVTEWAGGRRPADDQTLVVLRRQLPETNEAAELN